MAAADAGSIDMEGLLRRAYFFHDLVFTTRSGSSTTFDKFEIETPIVKDHHRNEGSVVG